MALSIDRIEKKKEREDCLLSVYCLYYSVWSDILLYRYEKLSDGRIVAAADKFG